MSSLRHILAWLVILAAAAMPFFSPQIRKLLSIRPPAVDPAEPSTQLLVTARLYVGTKPMLAANPAEIPKLVAQIQKLARSPLERLRLVPVLAELDQLDAARKTLAILGDDPSAKDLRDDIDALSRIYDPSDTPVTAAEQAGLIQRHGWFGQLAASHIPGASADTRDAARIPAQRAFRWMAGLGIVAFFTLALGLGIFVLLIVLYFTGMIQKRYVPNATAATDPAGSRVYLECFALYLLLWMLGGLAVRLIAPDAPLSYAWLLTPLVIFAVLWPSLNGRPWSEVRMALGWHAGSDWPKEVLCGVAGYLAFLPILAGGMFLTSYLLRFTDRVPSHPLINAITGNFRDMLGIYALACVFAPIVEESLFRGAFFHHLRGRWPWWVSAPIVAIIFAIIHPQGLLGLPVLILIALMLAGLREWRGSLIAPVVAHAINNFVATTVLFVLLT